MPSAKWRPFCLGLNLLKRTIPRDVYSVILRIDLIAACSLPLTTPTGGPTPTPHPPSNANETNNKEIRE